MLENPALPTADDSDDLSRQDATTLAAVRNLFRLAQQHHSSAGLAEIPAGVRFGLASISIRLCALALHRQHHPLRGTQGSARQSQVLTEAMAGLADTLQISDVARGALLLLGGVCDAMHEGTVEAGPSEVKRGLDLADAIVRDTATWFAVHHAAVLKG